jgi:hypothetical protein
MPSSRLLAAVLMLTAWALAGALAVGMGGERDGELLGVAQRREENRGRWWPGGDGGAGRS